MSFTNTAENSLLKLLFQNTDFAGVGDATGLRGSSTAGSFYVSLHTADPGESGSQDSSAPFYTTYAYVAVARSSGGFTVTDNVLSPAAEIVFPQSTSATGAGQVITHVGIGLSSSGAGTLIIKGALSPTITIANGVKPILTTASTITLE